MHDGGAPALPEVSVVMPTHNRRDSLRRVLEALDRQTILPGRFEVVVVCDGCTDGSAAMCRGLTTRYALRVFEQAKQGPAAARNRAVTEAAGALIVFLDDDVVPIPGLLAEHLAEHAANDSVVVIGPLLAPPGFKLAPWTRWESVMLDAQYAAMAAGRWEPTARQFYTGNASVRREHILAAGGFDPGFRRAEDVELAYRFHAMKLTFRFSPSAKGWHYADRPLGAWLAAARAYGEADVAMYRRGRLMTLQSMASEYRWRKPALRRLARFCVGRSFIRAPVVASALLAARAADLVGLKATAESAYSAVFNLTYWNGVSDALGGRPSFWSLIETGQPPALRPPA